MDSLRTNGISGNLTACFPLSAGGEGEERFFERAKALSNSPVFFVSALVARLWGGFDLSPVNNASAS